VISIWSNPVPPQWLTEDVQVTGGTYSADGGGWLKYLSTTRAPVGNGVAQVTLSRTTSDGPRQHSAADLRNVNARLNFPVGSAWTIRSTLAVGDQPRADNPGALTAPELAVNRDSAAAINLSTDAGKAVSQAQGGVTVARQLAGGGEASVTLFGLTRTLRNPQTYAYIDLRRNSDGVRASLTRPFTWRGMSSSIAAGVDAQEQRDDRVNYGINAGAPTPVRSLDQREKVREVGPFVQVAADVLPRLTLNAGARYDHVSFRVQDHLVSATNPDDSGQRDMHSPSFTGGAVFRATATTSVYATVGTSFETPTTTELANRPDTAGGFNPSLNPQQATNYEVGLRQSLDEHLSWSLAAYQLNVRDELIAFEEPSSPGRTFYRNAGRSRHRGVEAGAQWSVAPGISLSGSYTYSDFRYTRYQGAGHDLAGRQLPGIPPQWLYLLLHAEPASLAGTWADLDLSHAAGYLVDDTLDTRTAAWTTVGVRIGWHGRGPASRLSPFVAVNNLFDARYVSSVVINAARGRYYEPAPGRNFYFGLGISAGH
jgi:iron complex outermembrane receptor protein